MEQTTDNGKENVFSFNTKIVGNSFIENGETLLRNLKKDDTLIIEHETSNKFDENACVIKNEAGLKLGYIARDTAAKIVKDVKEGRVAAIVEQVTGGVEGKEHVGCNIIVIVQRSNINTHNVAEDRLR